MTARWNIGAVLLDMDGTLLDTEKIYFDSLVAALHAHGYADDAVALCQAMVGLPGPACEAMLLDRYGERFPLADISRAFIANRDKFMERRPAAQARHAGIAGWARRRRLPDGDRHLVVAALRRTHIFGLPESARASTPILTLDDVTRGKPSPDLYLLAAARLAMSRKLASRWRIPTTASPPPTPPAQSPSWCRTW